MTNLSYQERIMGLPGIENFEQTKATLLKNIDTLTAKVHWTEKDALDIVKQEDDALDHNEVEADSILYDAIIELQIDMVRDLTCG